MGDESKSLPVPAFAGGTRAITLTPVVGTPRRTHAEMFIPGGNAPMVDNYQDKRKGLGFFNSR